MPQFSYKAIASTGELLQGQVSATTQDAAIAQLRQRGLVPVEAKPAGGASRSKSGFFDAIRTKRWSEDDLALFTRQLSALLQAGYPLDRTLEKLGAINDQPTQNELAADLLTSIKSGATLASAMAKRSDAFPGHYVGMIRAGEASGDLTSVFDRLVEMLEHSAALRNSVQSALIYPMVVLVLTALSIIVLMVWVVPEFKPLFEGNEAKLPVSAIIVVAISDFTLDWGWALAAALAAFLLFARRMSANAEFRRRRDEQLLRMPIIGDIVRKTETARFARTLSTLIANGVTLLGATKIAGESLSNATIKGAMDSVGEGVGRGERLVNALRQTDAFPPLALQIIEVGEESGHLQEMLALTAKIFDDEVQRALQRGLALLVPIVTVGLGMLVALVIGIMLSAILSTYDLAL